FLRGNIALSTNRKLSNKGEPSRYGDNRDNEDVSVFTANPMEIVSFYPPLSVSYFSVPLRLCGEKSHNENCCV
ncbi:MAG: hypothetical protein V1749_11320, partial [Candidatus Desantisbacteria bacterium]